MKHLLKLSLILLAFLLPATAVANPITLQQAQQNALSFLESKGKSISSSSLRQARLRSTSTTTESYYIFNIGHNEGYVIAAGDDCAPAILGYADAGYIDVDSMPVNLQSWLEEYAQQIQFMQENGFASLKAPKLTSNYAVIPPLMTTTWDQQDPYNQNCPDFFSYGKCVTGCVATAMAQVMYYHRANSVAQTTAQIPAYDCRTLWLNGSDTLGHIHVDAIPAGSPIDWDNMLDSYGSSATTAQKQAVANLMKYCGASVRMNYANAWSGGSGAYSYDVPIALRSYFDYSDETTLEYRSDYPSDDAWESLVYNELSSLRPVYYSGRNSSGGHAFVCDGYDGAGYYHINWGWTSTSDGYFLLTALNPNAQGTGGTSSGYNQNQAAIINAVPKSSSPSNLVLAVSLSLNKTSAKLNPGGSLQLTETVLPSNTTNKTVTWTSSNSSVATVSSDGAVTAKAVGNVTITASTTDGSNLSASCYITVSNTTICFADANVEALCVQNWDTNGDGELSKTEAAVVTTIGTVFKRNGAITSFNELQYFTGLSSIDYDAFSGCTNLSSIIIPSSVIIIGSYAFEYCSKLTDITIPSSVTSIGDYAYRGCSSLASIKVESGNTTYDSRNNCNAIIQTSSNRLIVGCKNTDILNSVTAIGDGAFYGCTGITNLTIPSSITSISSTAFDYCSNLASVKVESGNSVYDSRNNCNAIIRTSSNRLIVGCKNTLIPNTITTIGEYAFYGCSSLSSITIPNSVTTIERLAFDDCSGLSSVTIPKSVISIGIRVFEGCSGLTGMIVENGNPKYDSRNNCNAIIETNSNRLISGCKNTTIPNNVTSIGEEAFSCISTLTSITIPSSIISIGDYAFHNCPLDKITCLASIPPEIYSNTFTNNVTNTANLYVLAESLTAYQNALYWKNFISIQEVSVLATSITLNKASAELTEGNTMQLTATVLPSNATNKTVTWTTSNSSVATVSSNGLVTAIAPGNVTITATTTDGTNLSASCAVTVNQNIIYATSISLNQTSAEITVGQILQLAANVLPTNATNRTVTWTSSNTSVASVNNSGLVQAKSTGNVIITATTTDGTNLHATCSLLVKQYATSILLSQTSANITEGETLQLTATVLPSNTTNKTVTWTTSNSGIATVNSYGLVTAIAPGNATITATTNDGTNLSASCSIAVKQQIVLATSININKSNATITEGETLQLTATVLPTNATNRTVTWTTSNNNIATVNSSGLVTAIAPGNVTITATTKDGTNLSKSCAVTVTPNIILASSVSLNESGVEMTEGETLQLTATLLPSNTTNKTVTWTSSNRTVASVTDNGLVTAMAPGTATITATTTDGSNLSASCVVAVTQDLSNYDNYLSLNDTTVFHGDTIVIPVQMNNSESIIAFQTDIVLPEGFSIVADADNEPLVTPSSRLTSDHVMMADRLNDGSVRVICYSLRSRIINGNEGDLFYISVAVPEDADGDYNILLRNTLLTTNDFSELHAPVVSSVLNVYSFIPGDVNDSRTVTVTDIVFTAQYILQRNPSPFIFAAADMNRDGNISVTDIMLISNLIMTPSIKMPKRMHAIVNNNDRMIGEDIALAAGETRTVSIALDNDMDYTAFQLDLHLPNGLTASNFQVTDRAGSHTFDVNNISDGTVRALCYSPVINVIDGHSGALLTFDVTATGEVIGDINVNGIELVTADCQTVKLDAFTIGVNNSSAVNELATGKVIKRVDYFNLAGQQIDRPESGVTLVVTTYTDGTRTTTKLMR